MNFKIKYLLFLIIILSSNFTYSQSNNPIGLDEYLRNKYNVDSTQNSINSQNQIIKIIINDYSKDLIGRRLVYFTKEIFRESKRFLIVDHAEYFYFKIIITTMDNDLPYPNSNTIFSCIWLIGGDKKIFPIGLAYITNTIGYCGSDRVKEVAENIVAETDRIISNYIPYINQ